MKHFIILASILLSGCMTSTLEAQSPIYKGHSIKSADALNRCLAPKWVELKPSASSVPTETGYKITASDDIFGAMAVANIVTTKNDESDISVYAVAKGWSDHWGAAARSCM